MTDPVVLAGPASARALSGWLHSEDGRRARELPGMARTALTNIVDAFLSAGHHVELVTLAPELRDEVVVLEGSRLRILIAPFRPVIRERCLDAFRQERRHVRALVARTSGRVVNAHWTYEFALGATDVPHRVTVVTAHDAPFTILRYQRPRRYLALRAAMAAALSMRAPALTARITVSGRLLAPADVIPRTHIGGSQRRAVRNRRAIRPEHFDGPSHS